MRKAESVANYIIAYGMQIRHPVSNLQLQKIICKKCWYIC